MAARLHETGCPRALAHHGWGTSECSCTAGRYEERSDVFDGTAVVLSIFRAIDGRVLFCVERKADGRVVVLTAAEMRA